MALPPSDGQALSDSSKLNPLLILPSSAYLSQPAGRSTLPHGCCLRRRQTTLKHSCNRRVAIATAFAASAFASNLASNFTIVIATNHRSRRSRATTLSPRAAIMNMCPLHHPILLTHICTLFARGGALSRRENVGLLRTWTYSSSSDSQACGKGMAPEAGPRHSVSGLQVKLERAAQTAARHHVRYMCAADLHRPLHVRPITRSIPCAHCLYVLCTHTFAGTRWLFRVTLACVILFRSVVPVGGVA